MRIPSSLRKKLDALGFKRARFAKATRYRFALPGEYAISGIYERTWLACVVDVGNEDEICVLVNDMIEDHKGQLEAGDCGGSYGGAIT
jgi:hypothetical protein